MTTPTTPLTPPQQAAFDALATDYLQWQAKYRATLNGELVPCNVVDIDPADDRAYIETFPGSEIRCLPIGAVQATVEA